MSVPNYSTRIKIEVIVTSLAKMLELPIFDHMVTCTILKIKRLKKVKKRIRNYVFKVQSISVFLDKAKFVDFR